MNRKLLKLAYLHSIAVVYFISTASGQVQSSASPHIDFKIKNCLHAGQNNNIPTVCSVANGDYIELRIHLEKMKNASVETPGPNMVNPNSPPAQGAYYLVKAVRESDGVEVPVKIFDTGGGNGSDNLAKEISFQIPYDDTARRAKIQAWWNKIKSNANTTDRAIIAQRPIKDDELFNAMDQRIVDNQLGQFQIICSYVSNKPGTWNGQVDSAPISVDVVNKGTLLDKNSP